MAQQPNSRVVLTGESPSGERWSITESVRNGSLFTMLRAYRGERIVFGGGMGGAAVSPGRAVNLSVGTEGDIVGIVVRVGDEVERVEIRQRDGSASALQLHGSHLVDGVRIGGTVLASGHQYTELVAYARNGRQLESRSLRRR